ncbi:LytR C-terminal domain-containing protein [Actinomycetes bacterium KLBMP 9797]
MTFARVRALVVVGALVTFALVFVVVALVRDSQSGEAPVAQCPEGWARVDLALRTEQDIAVNVYNGTDTAALANEVAADFTNRKFTVKKKGNDPKKKSVKGVAVLRYGPKAVGSAQVLRAYFLDEAAPEYDPTREDALVDVVIGEEFKQLATPTEKNQALAALGEPQLPPQSCAAEAA